jgi:hypothetical protein
VSLLRSELRLRWRRFFADVDRVDRTVAALNVVLAARAILGMTRTVVAQSGPWFLFVVGLCIWSLVIFAWIRFWRDGDSGAEAAVPAACWGVVSVSAIILFKQPWNPWWWFCLPIYGFSAYYVAERSTGSLRYS